MKPRLSEEAAFLIHACRESEARDAGLSARAAAVRDWDRVVDLAVRHDVVTLLLPFLDSGPTRALLPAATERALRSAAISRLAQVSPIREALPQLLGGLERAGVPVIVFKGPALAAEVYPHPALRVFGDLDLLCQEADRGRAERVISEQGFELVSEAGLPTRGGPCVTFLERHFVDLDRGVHVELHVDPWKLGLLPRCRDEFWSRSRTIEIQGVRTSTFAPDHALLTLALHLQRHGLRQLKWFKDLDLAIRHWGSDLDWGRVCRIAAEEELRGLVWHPLQLVAELFDTPVPREALGALRPNLAARCLLARTRAGLDPPRPPTPAWEWGMNLWNGTLVGRNRERSRELLRLVRERLL